MREPDGIVSDEAVSYPLETHERCQHCAKHPWVRIDTSLVTGRRFLTCSARCFAQIEYADRLSSPVTTEAPDAP